jgi:hypothetical protein
MLAKRPKGGNWAQKRISAPNELAFAAQVTLKDSGQTDVAKLVKNVLFISTRVTKIVLIYKNFSIVPIDVKRYYTRGGHNAASARHWCGPRQIPQRKNILFD